MKQSSRCHQRRNGARHNLKIMNFSRLRKYLPSRDQLFRSKLLAPVNHLLGHWELWHINRQSVANAFAIGVFCAFLPIPGQMLAAAVMAIVVRANMPISVALVWISNPLTFAPMIYASFRLGSWILGSDLGLPNPDTSWFSHFASLGQFWWPLLLGSLICGVVAGLAAAVAVRVVWRLDTSRRWRERRERRRAEKLKRSN